MTSFTDLRDARLGPLTAAGEAWHKLAGQARALTRRAVDELVGPAHSSGWDGSAARAALAVVDRTDDELELMARRSGVIAAGLSGAAERLRALQRRLHDEIEYAARQGMTVHADGSVTPRQLTDAEAAHLPEYEVDRRLQRHAHAAGQVEQMLAAIVHEATQVDLSLSGALNAMRSFPGGPSEMARALGLYPRDIPADPDAAAAWWAGLSEDQRRLYQVAYPDRVGAADGLPAAVRDEANRVRLRREIALAEGPTDGAARLLDALEAAEYGPANKRLMLLGIDTAGDGRAVVAIGNPDTAHHTAILVPGVNTDLGDMPGQIKRGVALQKAGYTAAGVDPSEVAVVAWLGYDAPEADLSMRALTAVGSERAEAGAPALDRFVDGQRASHQGDPAHVTVVGHSYGSVVVGQADSHGDGLAVDDIVVAGSPGMDVQSVHDLRIDPHHFWAGASWDDPISFIGDVGAFVDLFVPGDATVGHGADPASWVFDGNVYRVDTSGHSGYWEPDSQSLRNQGAVIAGQYAQVEKEYSA